MPRIVKKPGDILRFPLSAPGMYSYAQWLPDGTALIFLTATASELLVASVVALPVAFRVVVFKDTPNRYGWSKVGKASVPDQYSQPQRYAKKDVLSGELTLYFQGSERPATAAQLQGLETLAVWAHPHIVERLEAQLDHRDSKFLAQIRVVA